MFLRSLVGVGDLWPHGWLRAAALGLVALLVGAAGMGVGAEVQPPPRDPPPARPPDAPPPPRPGLLPPEIEELIRSLENLPAGADAQQLRDRVMKAIEELRKAQAGLLPPGAEDIRRRAEEALGRLRDRRRGASPAGGSRLGVRIEAPSAALTDHLDLPPGEGQVILEVVPDSAAARAGLTANDILLELNGKPVVSDSQAFVRSLEDIKPNTPVDVLVLRRGKKETIKGLTLSEAKSERPRRLLPSPGQLPLLPGRPRPGGPAAVLTTMVRTGDQFTTRYQEGGLTITLTGTVTDGKAKVEAIQVQDGGTSDRYDSVDKVPEPHRDRVKRLVEMSERGNVAAESKSP